MNKNDLPKREQWVALRDGINEEIQKYDNIGALIHGLLVFAEEQESPLAQQLKQFKMNNPEIITPTITIKK